MEIPQAKEILTALGGKYLPGKGTAVKQAENLMEEKGVSLNDKGELVDADGKLLSTLNLSEENKNKGGKKGKTYRILVNVLHNKEKYLEKEERELDEETAELFLNHKFAELIK